MYDKIVAMILKLSERTHEGKIDWEQTVEDGVFQAAFPNYSVQISHRPSNQVGEKRDFVIKIFNEDGALVEEVTDPDLRTVQSDAYTLMRAIYESARGKAMGVDDAIETIMAELTKGEIPF